MNNTLIVQLAPAASVPVGLHPALELGSGTEKSSASSPLVVNPAKFTVAVLVFVTVTLNGALVVVNACEPNAKLLGVTVTVAVPGVPVPVSVTVCGLPVALSVNAIVPLRVPVAVGLNEIWNVHGSASTAMLGHCPSVAPAKSPDIAMLVKVTIVLPVLFTVTVCVALVVPTAWLPNVNVVGEISSVPPVAGAPVPVSVIVVVCGAALPTLVYVTVTVPVSVPVAVGEKLTFTVQLDPVALPPCNVVGQVFVSPKFVLAAIPVIAVVLVPTFVIVTACDALVVPCAWLPNVNEVGFAVTFAPDELPAVKVTVTVWDPVIVTVQVGGFVCGLAGVQSVLKPINVESPVGVAVSTTGFPLSKFAEHVVGQLIPVGLLVTVPVPVPASVTVSVAGIIWHSTEVSPGFVLLSEISSTSHPEAT